jgi:hypothetical protein
MKCWKPFVLLGAAICGIVFLAQTIQDASATPPRDNRTARRNFLQSTFGIKGNFELYVPQGQVITHYWRNNDSTIGWQIAGDKIVYPCAPNTKCAKPRSITVIQSNFLDRSGHGNFEAIVRVAQQNEPDHLDFWHLDTDTWQWQGPFPIIADGQPVTDVTGDPVLIQSSWGTQGYFELFVPQGPYSFAYSCGPNPCYIPTGLSLIQSHYLGDGAHGNFEAVVRVEALTGESDHLDTWYFDSGTLTWHGPAPLVADGELAANITGDPVLIQSQWYSGPNFQVYVPQGHVVRHYYRDNDDIFFHWHVAADRMVYSCLHPQCATPRNVTFIQSNFAGDGVHGNLEAIVQVSAPLPLWPDHLDFYFLDSGTEILWGPFTMFANGSRIEVPIGF